MAIELAILKVEGDDSDEVHAGKQPFSVGCPYRPEGSAAPKPKSDTVQQSCGFGTAIVLTKNQFHQWFANAVVMRFLEHGAFVKHTATALL